MRFKLFQIKDVQNTDFAFMSYEWAKDYDLNGFYEMTYDGDIDTTYDMDVSDTLDNIFAYGNTGNFPNYNTRSVSVSDIIILGTNPLSAYYVDSFGFKKLTNENLSYADIEAWWEK